MLIDTNIILQYLLMIHSTLFFIWILPWCLFGSFQVQNLIERCLQLYMNPKEVVETLLAQAKIEPGFTELGSIFSSVVFFFLFLFSFITPAVLPCPFDNLVKF